MASVKRRVPSARELEIMSMRARVREITGQRRMRVLNYPHSRCEEVAFEEQYGNTMEEYHIGEDDGRSTSRSGTMRGDSSTSSAGFKHVFNPYKSNSRK